MFKDLLRRILWLSAVGAIFLVASSPAQVPDFSLPSDRAPSFDFGDTGLDSYTKSDAYALGVKISTRFRTDKGAITQDDVHQIISGIRSAVLNEPAPASYKNRVHFGSLYLLKAIEPDSARVAGYPDIDTLFSDPDVLSSFLFALGYEIGRGFHLQRFELGRVHWDHMVMGILDGFEGGMEIEGREDAFATAERNFKIALIEREKLVRQRAVQEFSDAFKELVDDLEQEGSEPLTLESGVVIVRHIEGEGKAITLYDELDAELALLRLNGELLKNDGRGKLVPALSRAGLQDALLSLKAGDQASIYVPASEAFGQYGNQELRVAPGEPIIYEVTIHDITNTFPPPPEPIRDALLRSYRYPEKAKQHAK